MDMTKKDGGWIERWSFNTLSISPQTLISSGVPVKTEKAYILSGYIKEDPTGRWNVGDHFRSSVVLDIDYESGIVETHNTIYRLSGESGGLGDLGNLILKVFY